MEESAPKRRRTSPRTSLEIPSESTNAPSPERPSQRKRPSFASPTKASLARHNPDVLERRRSQSPQKDISKVAHFQRLRDEEELETPSKLLADLLEKSKLSSRSRGDPEYTQTDVPRTSGEAHQESPSEGLARQLERSKLSSKTLRGSEQAPTRTHPLRMEIDQESPSQLFAKQLEKSLLSSDVRPPNDSELTPTEARQTRRVERGLQAPPKRTPNRPNPRPFPPPGSDEEEANPFLGNVLRRSPPNLPDADSTAMPPPERFEPELPPSAPGTASVASPRGIHSSPMRWRQKQKTSPLSNLRSHRRSASLTSPKKGLSQATLERRRTAAQATEAEEFLSSSPRKARVLDPNAEKKAERDALLKEIEELKKDLRTTQRENERIRAMHQSDRVLAPADPDEVIGLLKRQQPSASSEPPLLASQLLVKAVLNPIGLLPFGKPKSSLPQGSEELDDETIKSHHPVLMTAEEELPYLELFNPFSLTSKLSILPSETDAPLRQLHSITLRSRDLPGLFTAKIDLIVNALDLTILDMDVVALEPAARSELGPFLNKICSGDCNRTMQRNVGVVSWAMGEWARVAMERAAFWCQLEEKLGSKDAVVEATEEMRKRKSKRRKTSDEEDTLEEDEAIRQADLIRYMDRHWFEVPIPGDELCSVRFEWKIGFDWTGEAQSQLAVMIGVPGKWHQMDERASLGKMPKLFAELVDGGERLKTAVHTIVALMVGDGA